MKKDGPKAAWWRNQSSVDASSALSASSARNINWSPAANVSSSAPERFSAARNDCSKLSVASARIRCISIKLTPLGEYITTGGDKSMYFVTFLEALAVLAVIAGLIFEDKLIRWEDRMIDKVRGCAYDEE